MSTGYDRNKVDDIAARNCFKERVFSDGKVQTDEFGNLLHYDTQAAINKYGVVKAWDHRTEIDHKVPLKTVYEIGHMVGLSVKDIKEIANDESNFRILQARLNREKGDSSDLEMGAYSFKKGKFKQGIQFEVSGIEGIANMSVRIGSRVAGNQVNRTVKHLPKEVKAVANDTAMPLLVASVHNLVEVAQNNKSLKSAAKDSAVEAGTAVAAGKLQQLGVDATNQVLQKSGIKLLQQAADANIAGAVLVMGLRVRDSFVRFLDGKIGAGDFVFEAGLQSATLAAETMGAIIGQSLIPIPVVGGVLGSMVISVACAQIVDLMQTARECLSLDFVKHRRNMIEDISRVAKAEIDNQRMQLEQLIKADKEQWDSCVDAGFTAILQGMQKNDVEIIAGGLGIILSNFNKSVYFAKYEDFNASFMDENYEFNL